MKHKKSYNLGLLLMLAISLVSCKHPEARRPVSHSSGSFINESVERNKKIVAQEEAAIQEIIESDSLRDYISSPHGFWYYYNKKDTSSTQTPEFGDVVEFKYTLETLEGQAIYSEDELPRRTYAIDQQELFPGLREGLKLMHEGETATFLFPSHKAYGYYGDKKRIGTNLPVRSTVSLYTIQSQENENNSEENFSEEIPSEEPSGQNPETNTNNKNQDQ